MPLNVSAKCALFILLPLLHGCQGTGAMDPITTVEKLDIERFMGDGMSLQTSLRRSIKMLMPRPSTTFSNRTVW